MGYYKQVDLDILKPLLEKTAAIAASDRNAANIKRWRDGNAKRAVDMPPVFCLLDKEAWEEIMPPDSFECSDPGARALEERLKRILYKQEIDDDTPVYSYLKSGAVFDVDPPDHWGMSAKIIRPDFHHGAFKWDAPLKELEDFDKLVMPSYSYNPGKTAEKTERTAELTQGILDVKASGRVPCGSTIDDMAAKLRGITQLMMDLMLYPDYVNRLFRHLTDGFIKAVDYANASGLITPNTDGATHECDPFGPVSDDNTFTTANQWLVLNGQEFDSVSPRMWEEFLLPYQIETAKLFGKVLYGCCENLTRKTRGVLTVPNLAVFVCSIYSDLQSIIDATGNDYVIQWRQSPTDLFMYNDMSVIDETLKRGMQDLKGCSFQVVLREVQTLGGHPERLKIFNAMVKEYGVKYS